MDTTEDEDGVVDAVRKLRESDDMSMAIDEPWELWESSEGLGGKGCVVVLGA